MTKLSLFIGCMILSLFCIEASIAGAQFANQGQAEITYLDVQIVPVGNVPIARFGNAEEAFVTNAVGQDRGGDSSNGALNFSVITQSIDERPPSVFYVKDGGVYYVLNCSQNTLGSPVRIPITSTELDVYVMRRNAEGADTFRKAFTYTVTPTQTRLLFVVSKALAEKTWEKLNVNTYDLSPAKISDKSVVVINASSERYIIGVANQDRFALVPYEMRAITSDSSDSLLVQIAGSSDKENWSKAQRLSLPHMPAKTHLIFTYAVTPEESSRGFKVTRGKLTANDYRLARTYTPLK